MAIHVELQTRGSWDTNGTFNAPKDICIGDVRKKGMQSKSILHFSCCKLALLTWFDKMVTDHLSRDCCDGRHCNGRLTWPKGNSKKKSDQDVTECVIDDDDEI